MKARAWGNTDVGLKRSINQDSIFIDEGIGLFIVADGMGGHKGGEVASALAVRTAENILKAEMKSGSFRPRDTIEKIYAEACDRIFIEGHEVNPELAGMGTTMVLALFYEDNIYIGNVGDSRAYLFSDNKLWQITDDHSMINEQLRAGLIKEEDLDGMSGKNVITRSVGFEREVNVDIFERQVTAGESILMCSDGLSGLVTDEYISNLCATKQPEDLITSSIQEAKNQGGDDNISVVFISFS